MKVHTPAGLAATIRGRRLDLGLSQAHVAERAGVSRKWLWDVERGKATAEFGLLLRVFEALSLAVDIVPWEDERAAGSAEGAQLDAILEEHRDPPPRRRNSPQPPSRTRRPDG